jgi:O-antigen ligase
LYGLTDVQRASADRWLIALVGVSGLTLVTAECVRSLDAALEIAASCTFGAAVCALVALYQSITFTDPLDLVRSLMVGMTQNGGNTTFQLREGFVRVAGSTFTPIELGVVSAMVLPLAIWRSLFATRGKRSWHWLQTLLVAVAALLTVSRSAVLGLAVAAAFAIPFLPRTARRWALLSLPVGLVAVFMLMPGFVSTLGNAFTAGTSDPSLSTRVNNFPRVQAMVRHYPLTGQGPATYIPTNALEILDNQYLHSAVEMGVIGAVAVLIFFTIPVAAALQSAVAVHEPSLRSLAGCVAACTAIALVGSATFDAFSFPVFMIIYPVTAGLAGAVWNLARRAGHGPASTVEENL